MFSEGIVRRSRQIDDKMMIAASFSLKWTGVPRQGHPDRSMNVAPINVQAEWSGVNEGVLLRCYSALVSTDFW